MTKMETIEDAAKTYADSDVALYRTDSRGPRELSEDAFTAGAKWQEGCGQYTLHSHRERIATLEADNAKLEKERNDWHGAYDQMVSDLVHGRDHFIKGPVNGVGIPRLVPRMPAVSGVSQTEIMAAIIDVGQKVEAVLDQVMPKEEPKSALQEMWDGIPVSVGVDTAKPGTDKTVISVRHADGIPHNVIPPKWAGDICNVVEFGGRLYVCCAASIFVVNGFDLIPLRFTTKSDT